MKANQANYLNGIRSMLCDLNDMHVNYDVSTSEEDNMIKEIRTALEDYNKTYHCNKELSQWKGRWYI